MKDERRDERNEIREESSTRESQKLDARENESDKMRYAISERRGERQKTDDK